MRPAGSVATAARAGLAAFLLVFAAGFALGALRVFVVAPHLGETAAVLAELPVMLTISFVVWRWVLGRLPVLPAVGLRLLAGGSAFCLLMAAEAGVGLGLMGRSLPAHLAHYATLPGVSGLAAQLVFALMPAMMALRRPWP